LLLLEQSPLTYKSKQVPDVNPVKGKDCKFVAVHPTTVEDGAGEPAGKTRTCHPVAAPLFV
jgi:hypothetical protein